jgi:hypothetical protein
MCSALLLAVVVGAGRIPVPESVSRFPDPVSFAGIGPGQEATMVTQVLADAGGALRSSGPGPQQLVARWQAGQLNAAEKVVALLGGAAFHDVTMLRIYGEAMTSPDARVRMAAAVGYFAAIGDLPPAPSSVRDTPEEWGRFSSMLTRLAWAARSRSLVQVWADSFAAAKGAKSPSERFVFRRPGQQCLRAIREIAQPEDLPEVLALWPLLDREEERGHVMRTIELITLQRLVNRSLDPHKPRSQWEVRAALAAIDGWVAGLCRPLDGGAQLRLAFEANHLVGRGEPINPAAWFFFLNSGYASSLPLAIEHLADISGAWVEIDRQYLENPANKQASKPVLELFPISSVPPPPRSGQR